MDSCLSLLLWNPLLLNFSPLLLLLSLTFRYSFFFLSNFVFIKSLPQSRKIVYFKKIKKVVMMMIDDVVLFEVLDDACDGH